MLLNILFVLCVLLCVFLFREKNFLLGTIKVKCQIVKCQVFDVEGGGLGLVKHLFKIPVAFRYLREVPKILGVILLLKQCQ